MSAETVSTAVATILNGLAIAPTTTLTQQANVGDTTIHVTSTVGMSPRSLLTWWDGTAEETLAVSSVDPVALTVTLDFTGVGYTGLQFQHANAASVGVNLYTDALADVSPMLAMGHPCMFILATDTKLDQFAQRAVQETHTIHIQYHRLLTAPGGQSMDVNVWARRQQQSARADLYAIEQAIAKNPHLVTPTGRWAEGLGPRGQNSRMTSGWKRLAKDAETQMFAAALDVVVRDLPYIAPSP